MKHQIIQCFFLILYRLNFITSFNCSRNSKETCLTDCSWSTKENKCEGIENDLENKDHLLAIGISVGCGVVIVIAVFIVITTANRRFFMRHMRQNALYVGSVVAERCVPTDICRPEQPTSFSDSNNDVYSVVNSLRRPNRNDGGMISFRISKDSGSDQCISQIPDLIA